MDLSRVLRSRLVVEHVEQIGAPDEMGDPTEEKTWTVFLGYVWQTQADETTANSATAREDWQFALERSARGQIDAGDRIYADAELDEAGDYVEGTGRPFDVDGPPWEALNPRTQIVEYVHGRLVRSW